MNTADNKAAETGKNVLNTLKVHNSAGHLGSDGDDVAADIW